MVSNSRAKGCWSRRGQRRAGVPSPLPGSVWLCDQVVAALDLLREPRAYQFRRTRCYAAAMPVPVRRHARLTPVPRTSPLTGAVPPCRPLWAAVRALARARVPSRNRRSGAALSAPCPCLRHRRRRFSLSLFLAPSRVFRWSPPQLPFGRRSQLSSQPKPAAPPPFIQVLLLNFS